MGGQALRRLAGALLVLGACLASLPLLPRVTAYTLGQVSHGGTQYSVLSTSSTSRLVYCTAPSPVAINARSRDPTAKIHFDCWNNYAANVQLSFRIVTVTPVGSSPSASFSLSASSLTVPNGDTRCRNADLTYSGSEPPNNNSVYQYTVTFGAKTPDSADFWANVRFSTTVEVRRTGQNTDSRC